MSGMQLMHFVRNSLPFAYVRSFQSPTGKQVHKCINCIRSYADARTCARSQLSGNTAQSALSAFGLPRLAPLEVKRYSGAAGYTARNDPDKSLVLLAIET